MFVSFLVLFLLLVLGLLQLAYLVIKFHDFIVKILTVFLRLLLCFFKLCFFLILLSFQLLLLLSQCFVPVNNFLNGFVLVRIFVSNLLQEVLVLLHSIHKLFNSLVLLLQYFKLSLLSLNLRVSNLLFIFQLLNFILCFRDLSLVTIEVGSEIN